MSETWRVVLESGEVRAVLAERHSSAWSEAWSPECPRLRSNGINERGAVTRLAGDCWWSVAQILAPGELSTAEQVAAMRDRCAAACDAREEAARATRRECETTTRWEGHQDACVKEWEAAACAADIRGLP